MNLPTSTIKQRRIRSAGFTLIELAVVIIIIGLLSAAGFRAYDTYRARYELEYNAFALAALNGAIGSYFIKNGHFPCPAPLSAHPGDASYGRSMDCSQAAAGDYRLSTRDIDFGNGTTVTMRVREGTFPFADLQEFMMQNDTTGAISPTGQNVLDAQGNQFTYVVTEAQTLESSYRDRQGAILLKDEHNRIVAPNVDYLIISHGKNGTGARIGNGQARPCTGQGLDLENCDGDAEFIHGARSYATGANYYDDHVSFMKWLSADLWRQTPTNPDNIYNINPGYVGIGVKTPTEQLHIKDGNLLTSRIWDNPASVEASRIRSERICADNGTDCMNASIIAGQTLPRCGASKLTTGIAHNQPVCVDAFQGSFTNNCAANSYAYSLTYNAATKSLSVACRDPRAGRGDPGVTPPPAPQPPVPKEPVVCTIIYGYCGIDYDDTGPHCDVIKTVGTPPSNPGDCAGASNPPPAPAPAPVPSPSGGCIQAPSVDDYYTCDHDQGRCCWVKAGSCFSWPPSC